MTNKTINVFGICEIERRTVPSEAWMATCTRLFVRIDAYECIIETVSLTGSNHALAFCFMLFAQP
jgi:hypothetical protein